MKKFVDWPRLKDILSQQIGKPYKFGVEVKITEANPLEFDCSELVEWAFGQMGIKVPDGSYNQYDASIPVKGVAQFGDLAFFRRPDGTVYHVGILFNCMSFIEARGNPANKVKLTPIAEWVNHPNFSGLRRLKAVLDNEPT